MILFVLLIVLVKILVQVEKVDSLDVNLIDIRVVGVARSQTYEALPVNVSVVAASDA